MQKYSGFQNASCGIIHPRNFPWILFSWIIHLFHFLFNLSILVSSLFRLHVTLSGNSYLSIEKSSLIYLPTVKLCACWQHIQSLVITVSQNSAWWDISTFRHNWEVMTCSSCLEVNLYVAQSQPGNYAHYFK